MSPLATYLCLQNLFIKLAGIYLKKSNDKFGSTQNPLFCYPENFDCCYQTAELFNFFWWSMTTFLLPLYKMNSLLFALHKTLLMLERSVYDGAYILFALRTKNVTQKYDILFLSVVYSIKNCFEYFTTQIISTKLNYNNGRPRSLWWP